MARVVCWARVKGCCHCEGTELTSVVMVLTTEVVGMGIKKREQQVYGV